MRYDCVGVGGSNLLAPDVIRFTKAKAARPLTGAGRFCLVVPAWAYTALEPK